MQTKPTNLAAAERGVHAASRSESKSSAQQSQSVDRARTLKRAEARAPAALPTTHSDSTKPAPLRRRAEALVRTQARKQRQKIAAAKSEADPQRLLHELQVHHVELEMQNAELQEARDRMEVLLEKFTDLYDFSPVGYLSLDEDGRILEVNLTGAALLGVARSQLINRRLPSFVATNRPTFLAFLTKVFAGDGKQTCEATLRREDGTSFWAGFHGTSAISLRSPQKWCRVVVSDITVLKQAEEAHRRAKVLALSNEELKREIALRLAKEEALQQSERHKSQMLDQLRNLSRQVLQAQEEERKRISRELHDVIAQTLTGINIQLTALKKEAALNREGFDHSITRTQKLVEHSVDIVHEFARELRPAVLDDLGLIPALHSFVKIFSKRTRIRVHLKTFAGVESFDSDSRTILYRVAQEALTNVSRHAQASRVEVSIQKLPDCICMKITDDGKSFQVERVLHANRGKRLGLLGMRERLEMIGGSFEIESLPGKGTTIIAQIPLTNGKRV